jgi:hypothetical protein
MLRELAHHRRKAPAPGSLPVYGEDRWGIFPSTCAIQPGCARRFPKLPHQFSPLANPRCRKLAKLSPGYSAQRIFAPSQSHGGQPAAVQRRDGDVIEREPGTSAGLLKPTRSRRYNVREVKNLLFEAGEERSRGRGMQAHPPQSPNCPSTRGPSRVPSPPLFQEGETTASQAVTNRPQCGSASKLARMV